MFLPSYLKTKKIEGNHKKIETLFFFKLFSQNYFSLKSKIVYKKSDQSEGPRNILNFREYAIMTITFVKSVNKYCH